MIQPGCVLQKINQISDGAFFDGSFMILLWEYLIYSNYQNILSIQIIDDFKNAGNLKI